MAEKTIPSSIVQDKPFSPKTLDSVALIPVGDVFLVSSRDMALHFQKKHKHILEEIKRIQSITPKSFTEPNLRPSEYEDSTGRKLPCFLLTRDAFSLLAMGFTGKAAIQWKLRYIEAFNALEAAALGSARQAALREGFQLRTRLTPERTALVRRAARYRARGFSQREIAKLLDCGRAAAAGLLRDADLLGAREGQHGLL